MFDRALNTPLKIACFLDATIFFRFTDVVPLCFFWSYKEKLSFALVQTLKTAVPASFLFNDIVNTINIILQKFYTQTTQERKRQNIFLKIEFRETTLYEIDKCCLPI